MEEFKAGGLFLNDGDTWKLTTFDPKIAREKGV